MKRKFRTRFRDFKARFFYNLRRVSPLLMLRLVAAIVFYFPWLVFSLVSSWLKLRHWRKVEVAQDFMRRHQLAFEEVDATTLEVQSRSGGVSNYNQIWSCRKYSGEQVKYFVKVFVSAGSFWAKHLSLVSPFPAIYGRRTQERFTVDMISRVELAEKGIPVPKLVAYDAVQHVMVTEHLSGETVDEVLKRLSERQQISDEDREVVRQCGVGLAKIHRAGFSLIDTQPVNCIWVSPEQKVYFTDLEFCTREDKRLWDIGFFLCLLVLGIPLALTKQIQEIFLWNYQKERKINLAGVKETSQGLKEYLPIFQTILDLRQFTPEELFEGLISG